MITPMSLTLHFRLSAPWRPSLSHEGFESTCRGRLSSHVAPCDSDAIFGPICGDKPGGHFLCLGKGLFCETLHNTRPRPSTTPFPSPWHAAPSDPILLAR